MVDRTISCFLESSLVIVPRMTLREVMDSTGSNKTIRSESWVWKSEVEPMAIMPSPILRLSGLIGLLPLRSCVLGKMTACFVSCWLVVRATVFSAIEVIVPTKALSRGDLVSSPLIAFLILS